MPDPLVYHVTLERDWVDALDQPDYRISTRGARFEDVGFIHSSFEHQFARVGAALFRDVSEPLVVLVIDTERLNLPVVVEDLADEGEAFPHIYGPVPIDAVVDVLPASISAEGELVVHDL